MQPAFHSTVRRHDSTLCLIPVGELDPDSCPAFDQVAHMVVKGATVACTMEHVPFMDLSGLHCLLTLARRIEARGARLIVYAWQPQPQRLLEFLDRLIGLPDGKDRERRAAPQPYAASSIPAHSEAGTTAHRRPGPAVSRPEPSPASAAGQAPSTLLLDPAPAAGRLQAPPDGVPANGQACSGPGGARRHARRPRGRQRRSTTPCSAIRPRGNAGSRILCDRRSIRACGPRRPDTPVRSDRDRDTRTWSETRTPFRRKAGRHAG
ncbi:STAS domain-containing protein [Streptomyces virginiae]|uniref:STAS domain-containing protein n=1 Tax=Streptomyces virginiae TaxID=1961 RepID=UPI0036F9FCB2